MNKFSIEQFKKALSTIRMSEHERTRVRRALEQYIHTAYTKPIRSPFLRHANTFILRPMQAIAMILVVLVSSGAGLSYAANEALPGEPLYGFKVNINEEILTIAMDSETRAQYEVSRAAKRLEETAQLAIMGRIDAKTETTIREQLAKHTQKAQASAKEASVNNPETTIAITSRLENELTARGKVLEEIKAVKNDDDASLTTIIDATQTTLDEIAIDKENAIQAVALENTEVTKERVEKKRIIVDEKLKTLENLMLIPSEKLSSDVTQIEDELDQIQIEETMQDATVTTISEASSEETPLEAIDETLSQTIDDPTSIESLTENITIIQNLIKNADAFMEDKEYGKAFESLQRALEKADETLKNIELKEQYSQALEDSLVDESVTTIAPLSIVESATTTDSSISQSISQETRATLPKQ